MVERPAGRWGQLVAHLRTAHPYALDVAVAAVVAVPLAVPFVTEQPGGATPLGALLTAGTVVPLVWRRRWPFAVACVVGAFALLVSSYGQPGQMLQYGLLVAVYTVADLGLPWQRWSVITGVLGTLLLEALLVKDYSAPQLMFTLLLPLTAFLLGLVARAGRARAEALEDRARELERRLEADAARAAAEERARIAHDMHDVLAHAVSLMVVQAEAGPVVARDPDRAARVFDAIASAGREAMAQLRGILGLLEHGRDDGARTPPPTVSAIPALLDQVRGTGLQVRLRTTGERRTLGPDVELTVYRLVQESLTNTLKHARARTATVTLDYDDEGLVVAVSDDGTGVRADSAAPPEARGHGLTGIRARVAACGGTVEAGPAPGGGFRVTAWLPYSRGPDPGRSPTGDAVVGQER